MICPTGAWFVIAFDIKHLAPASAPLQFLRPTSNCHGTFELLLGTRSPPSSQVIAHAADRGRETCPEKGNRSRGRNKGFLCQFGPSLGHEETVFGVTRSLWNTKRIRFLQVD